MLGTEPEVIQNYVETGQIKIVFWPVLNHGDPSVYATLTAQCVGLQDADKFWDAHELLFLSQRDLWRADRDYFVDTAVSLGIDQAAFEACYDDGSALDQVLQLDDLRKERGIFGQPYFDIAGTLFGGAPSFTNFAEVVDPLLANAP